jgi:nitroreductase
MARALTATTPAGQNTVEVFAADTALARAVDRSRLAPSVHNTQPWRWAVQAGTARLYADRTRQLTVLDSSGREMVLSCGAGLFHARAALLAAGRMPSVEEFPDSTDPDMLARITLVPASEGSLDPTTAGVLDAAAEQRHTSRRGFHGPVDPESVDHLGHAAEQEHAILVPLTTVNDRAQVKVWQQKADQDQMRDPAYRRELDHWVGPTRSVDGIPLEDTVAQGPRPHDLAARDFAVDAVGVLPDEHDDPDTLLFALATVGDEPAAWLRAGQALARVWLEATRAGLVLQPLSQAMENGIARMNLRAELRLQSYWPQLILRCGHAPAGSATPRRPLDDLLVIAS